VRNPAHIVATDDIDMALQMICKITIYYGLMTTCNDAAKKSKIGKTLAERYILRYS
jgi:hypothetical protein